MGVGPVEVGPSFGSSITPLASRVMVYMQYAITAPRIRIRRMLREACTAKITMETTRHIPHLILVDKISPTMHKMHSVTMITTFENGNATISGFSFISWVFKCTNGAKCSEIAKIGM